MRRIALLFIFVLACPLHASAQRLIGEFVFAEPGTTVNASVTYDSEEQEISTLVSDIEIDPLIAVLENPALSCAAGPTGDAIFATFTCIVRCVNDPDCADRFPELSDPHRHRCIAVRAIVSRLDGPLSDGVLYSCTFAIDNDTPDGTYPLAIFSAVENADGAFIVSGPTPTPTGTPTATETGTPTDTPTPTPTRAVVVSGQAVRPGDIATLQFELFEPTDQIADLQLELALDGAVFDLSPTGFTCELDPRLMDRSLGVIPATSTLPLRLAISDTLEPIDIIGSGPLLRCRFRVRADAPAGPSAVTFTEVLAGTATGTTILGVLGIGGEVAVDPDLPLPTETPTPTATDTPTATETPTPTPTDTDTPTPTPTVTDTATPADTPTPTSTPTATVTHTPTATPIRCIGDCNGSSRVGIDELIRAVNIALNAQPVGNCVPADRDRNLRVTVDELVAAVNNALRGCPFLVSSAAPMYCRD